MSPLVLDLTVARVAVACAPPLLAPLLDSARVMGFDTDGRGPADADLVVEQTGTLPPPPPGAPVETHHPQVVVYADPEVAGGWRLRTPHGETRVAGPHAHMHLTPDVLGVEITWHLCLSLELAARRCGAFPLHAAALARGRDAVLVVGPSDVGKSTLAYTLVRDGWSYLSDDSVLLVASPGGAVEVVPFRRRFGLDDDGRFADLVRDAEPQVAEPGKWSVDVARLHPGQACTRATAGLLLFPALTGAARTRTSPMPTADAYVRLLAQSAQRDLRDDQTEAHHALLSRLVGQARALRLDAGFDLRDTPGVASACVGRELAAALASPAHA